MILANNTTQESMKFILQNDISKLFISAIIITMALFTLIIHTAPNDNGEKPKPSINRTSISIALITIIILGLLFIIKLFLQK